ncbi:MAG TPA: pyridoxal phosphate-dependent aminotransferase [Elusimicrobiales bacterium]|nr:pyridoxal phosphate-dependent aminotransferase [Elusimicrobiales bacterium]
MRLANRVSRLGQETAFEVLAKAKKLEAEGKKIVHLEIGEPDFDTPRNIREAAKKAIDKGWTHYGPSGGLPQLKEAIVSYIERTRHLKYDPDQVVVMPGGKPVMYFLIHALVNEGDEVIYPNPGFPIYESVINFVGAKPVPIQIKEEKEFNLDVSDLEKLLSPKTKLLILNSPQNPCGGVLSLKELEKIADLLKKYPDVMVMSDEIYSEILYEGKHHSIAALDGMKDRTIILDGYSKTFAMTGWRLGYAVCPKDIAPSMVKLMNNSVSCTASFTQIAGIEALNGPWDDVKKMVAEFKTRRDVIVEGLNKIPGFTCRKPNGAFYVFPNIKKTGVSSKDMADMLLYEGGVACLSGASFGAFGEGYIRFSYANSVENIKIALDSIKKLSHKWAK